MNILDQLSALPQRVEIKVVKGEDGRVQSDFVRRANASHNTSRAKTYDGKTTAQWAEHYGAKVQTIQSRIRFHGSPHPRANSFNLGRPVYGDKTALQWAQHYDVSVVTIRSHLKRWGNLDRL